MALAVLATVVGCTPAKPLEGEFRGKLGEVSIYRYNFSGKEEVSVTVYYKTTKEVHDYIGDRMAIGTVECVDKGSDRIYESATFESDKIPYGPVVRVHLDPKACAEAADEIRASVLAENGIDEVATPILIEETVYEARRR